MRQRSGWIISNAARFSALWLAALTVGVLAVSGGSGFEAPHSIIGILMLPLAPVVTVFLSAVTAFVAFFFFTPVLAFWLALYLAVLLGLALALPSDRSARLAGVIAAPLLWVAFVHSGDRLVDDVSLTVICLYGLLAKPWPKNQSSSHMTLRNTPPVRGSR
jgi:hypothetical protein